MTATRPITTTDLRFNCGLPACEIVQADSRKIWRDVVSIRRAVFSEEQRLVDVELTDVDDSQSLTLVVYLDGRAVATGRLSPASPGRSAWLAWIATLPRFRGRGLGTEITRCLVEASDLLGYGELHLSAQTHAVRLYERFGFEPFGAVFTVRGIPHQTMVRPAPRQP